MSKHIILKKNVQIAILLQIALRNETVLCNNDSETTGCINNTQIFTWLARWKIRLKYH